MNPPATFTLSSNLERVAAEYTEQRYSGPGNPIGAELRHERGVLATKVPFAPGNPLMNGVHGLIDPEPLGGILEFYAATGQPCWIDVAPYATTALTEELCRAGFRPASYSSVMYASPVPQVAIPRADIVEIDGPGLDAFLDTMNLGFGVPESMLPTLRRNQSFWPNVETWHLLLARLDGAPAAAAVLSRHGTTAYLAAASTLPAFRGRGLHAALIAARLALAERYGCELVTGQAAAGSVSQCNQQRAGLGLAHTKTVWTNQA